MTISMVEVFNQKGESLAMTLDESSGSYYVKEITGLDPVKAEVTLSSGASDGAQYQSSRRENRNIVMTLGYNPDYAITTVSQLRKDLYKKFMPKAPISMQFTMDDGLVVQTGEAILETFDAPLFVKDPEIKWSVIVFGTDFADIETKIVSGVTTPTPNTAKVVFDYDGTIGAGIALTVNFNRDAAGGITIVHQNSANVVVGMFVQYDFLAGDVLTIWTTPGNKAVDLARGGVSSSILYALDDIGTWITLSPGQNAIELYLTGAAVPYDVEYIELHGGL